MAGFVEAETVGEAIGQSFRLGGEVAARHGKIGSAA